MPIKKILNRKGFTLIELIATLVLAGIIVSLVGAGLAKIVDGLLFTKTTATAVQKGQVAATRLVNEFKNIGSVSFASSTSITFSKYGLAGEHTVRKSGSNLMLKLNNEEDILMDNVDGFHLRYFDSYSSMGKTIWSPSTSKVIEFTIRPEGGINTEFTTRVTPRNL